LSVKNIGFALCCVTVAAGLGYGQASAPSKFCVIQAEAALVSTKDGQAAVGELEKALNPKKSALQKQQADIQEMQDKLQKQSNTLSQTAKDDAMWRTTMPRPKTSSAKPWTALRAG
jgi:Skp family chaperone for outer membrane proteins